MSQQSDRLYELLPVYTRQQDAEQGYLLRDLLRVIAEQVEVVEEDISQLYENWFIETCQDWVAPYLGDLVGYRPVHEAGEPGEVSTPQDRQRNKILIPRREVANTIYYRRRKGTLALLELLANQVAGWPARAVEFYRLLSLSQALNHLQPGRGGTVDLRQGDALDRLNGPFDELAHTVDVRRISSNYPPTGRYNIPSVGLFVWRLKTYPVTRSPACCLQNVEEAGAHCFTFSLLGNDCPLYPRPQPEAEPTVIATEPNLPTPIRRRAFELEPQRFYTGPNNEDKSVAQSLNKGITIWKSIEDEQGNSLRDEQGNLVQQYIPPELIIPTNLEGWHYTPSGAAVAVDPALGRIAFNPDAEFCPSRVWVSYYYGFSADIGGGEYNRPIWPIEPVTQADPPLFFRIHAPQEETDHPITAALNEWQQVNDKRPHAVIELLDSGEYPELLNITLKPGQSLQIRAANRTRPVITIPEMSRQKAEFLRVNKKSSGGRLTLDGLTIAGRSLRLDGRLDEVNLRHCTLVPGWELFPTGLKTRPAPAGPSLLIYARTRLNIEHSISGSIQVHLDEVTVDPIQITISDSILDATSVEEDALSGVVPKRKAKTPAHVRLTLQRSTVIGQVRVHAIELAENSIFNGPVKVARRQLGCLRFCYLPPDSLTPRRFNCQPDLADKSIEERKKTETRSKKEWQQLQAAERIAVQPQFNSLQYGTPTYCQLAAACAEEIKRGADDEAEMGVFHDLYQPQRAANLQARLEEYTPAGADAGLIYAS